MIALTLPFPPPLNGLYPTAGVRRVKSRRYQAWLLEAWAMARQQRIGKLKGHFDLDLCFDRPDLRRRDLDGLCKAIADFLVKLEAVEDDSLADKIVLRWSGLEVRKPAMARVTVTRSVA